MVRLITCPICDQPIRPGEMATQTPDCAVPPEHPLYGLCSAWVHIHCFERWPYQEAFGEACYRQKVSELLKKGWLVASDARSWFAWFVSPEQDGLAPMSDIQNLVEGWEDGWPVVPL